MPKDKEGKPLKPKKGKQPAKRKTIVVFVPVTIIQIVQTPFFAFRYKIYFRYSINLPFLLRKNISSSF